MDPSKPQLLPDDVVGDTRRIRIVSIDPSTGKDRSIVGEAWQDADGNLHGTGVAAVMLFQPVAQDKYRTASVAADLSPLSILYARIARTSFLRVEIIEP
jgi:hypothetical protein